VVHLLTETVRNRRITVTLEFPLLGVVEQIIQAPEIRILRRGAKPFIRPSATSTTSNTQYYASGITKSIVFFGSIHNNDDITTVNNKILGVILLTF
jgi:hypothetical protein